MKRRNFLKLLGVSACTVVGIKAVTESQDKKVRDFIIKGHQHTPMKSNKVVMMSTPSGKESELYRLHQKMMINSMYGMSESMRIPNHMFGPIQLKLS